MLALSKPAEYRCLSGKDPGRDGVRGGCESAKDERERARYAAKRPEERINRINPQFAALSSREPSQAVRGEIIRAETQGAGERLSERLASEFTSPAACAAGLKPPLLRVRARIFTRRR